LAATSREIREEHESLYLKRKKFERSTPVFSYPLPWQPGWRNLIRGRPLGGNRFLVRDNRAEVVRAILHQIPYYIPPVMIANLINIGIFAFMMGVIEVFPNLLALFMGSSKNLSLGMNASLEGETLQETSGEVSVSTIEEGEAESSIDLEMSVLPEDTSSDKGAQAVDATFYYILFVISLIAAFASQFLRNHDMPGNLRLHRVTDLLHVVLLTVVPLLLVPSFLPIGGGTGTWIGSLIERSARFLFQHLNYHTAVLLCFTVWFIYNVDVNEDVLF